MRKILLLFMLISGKLFAQTVGEELVATAGDTHTSPNMQISWSIGEVVTELFSNDSNFISQGIHQSAVTILTSLDEMDSMEPNITVFPNPAANVLKIETGILNGDIGEAKLFDLNGKLVLSKKLYSRSEELDISNLKNNLYLLKIACNNRKNISTFKIQKSN